MSIQKKVIIGMCIAIMFVIGLIAGGTFLWQRGIVIFLHNTGNFSLQRVIVHITDHLYEVGTILPRETKQLTIHPTRESDLEIEYWKDEKAIRLRIDTIT